MDLRDKLTHQEQISEAFILSVFLAFSGGLQDAYTYTVRGNVFANAQTGNVVLMSVLLMRGDWLQGLQYLCPLLSFSGGVFVTDRIQSRFKNSKKLHWRQGVLLIEVALLFAVGFIPQGYNMAANVLVSFSCAMQLHAFRKVSGNPYASTMCIGNLRSGTSALSAWLSGHDPKDARRAGCYFGIILVFAIGAGIGGNLALRCGMRVIWISDIFLLIAFLLMELDRNRA